MLNQNRLSSVLSYIGQIVQQLKEEDVFAEMEENDVRFCVHHSLCHNEIDATQATRATVHYPQGVISLYFL